MNEVNKPVESKEFVRILALVSLIWLLIGSLVNSESVEQVLAFIQIFLFSFLDLVFLILLFWFLFFLTPEQKALRGNKVRIVLFGFFKLVCLAFLAITLKRLRNAPITTHLMGVSIIWIAPIISGICWKYLANSKKN
jgi:L-asparagine transporter-like permease